MKRRHKIVVEVTFSRRRTERDATKSAEYFLVGKRFKDVLGTRLRVMQVKQWSNCLIAACNKENHP